MDDISKKKIPSELYRIQYDGTVVDELNFSCIGGDAEAVLERVRDGYDEGLDRDGAIRLANSALAGPDRTLEAGELEVAVLEGGNGRRCFRRHDDAAVAVTLS